MSAATPPVLRVDLVSLHTSPLERPGSGDAGGMNVYVLQTARELARRGAEVDVWTRATAPGQGTVLHPVGSGAGAVRVHHVVAGPEGPVPKEDLPALVPTFAERLADAWAGRDTVVHAHYWLSALAALRAREMLTTRHPCDTAPSVVATLHTVGAVKNARLAPGQTPEPDVRIDGEARVLTGVDALVVNTVQEREDLLAAGATADIAVVPPGVDPEVFRPRPGARARLGADPDAVILLVVGRIQHLKGQDVLVRAAGEMLRRDPSLRPRLRLVVLGGLSGTGLEVPGALTDLIGAEGLTDVVEIGPPVDRPTLADWYRAADVVAVPSHHESFGLVAVEALACGAAVVAARVGGLPYALADAGVLVDGHDPGTWAEALADTVRELGDPTVRRRWRDRALARAADLTWARTADDLLRVYAATPGPSGAGSSPRPDREDLR